VEFGFEIVGTALCDGDAVRPGAVEHQQLGTIQHPVTAVEDETVLIVAPAGERIGLLSSAPDVEQFVAGVDDRAVGVSDEHRRISRASPDTSVSSSSDAPRDFAQVDEAPPLSDARECE
jgi:hypothetical protein